MPRRLFMFVLALCLCWQSLAGAGAGVAMAQGDEQAHAALHFEGQPHHHDQHHDQHHDDQAPAQIHLDDSPASTHHALEHACCHAPALPTAHVLHLAARVQPTRPAEPGAQAAPPPFLAGLERPPRLTA